MLMMRILWASTDCTVTRQGLLMLMMRALFGLQLTPFFPAGPPAAHDAHLLSLNGLHCHPAGLLMLMMRILWASTDCTVTRQGLLMLIMRTLWASTDSIFPPQGLLLLMMRTFWV